MDIREDIKSQILSTKRDMRLDNFLSSILFGKNGYYIGKNPIGKKKDFVTSPEISQMFGEIIGLYLLNIWQNKINSNFNLIELGPGQGTLFGDIFNSVLKYPNFIKKAKVTFVEVNKILKAKQKSNIAKYKIQDMEWRENINFKSNLPSIIYSNEFFDCFPVRQFVFNKCWFEKFISFNEKNNNFYFKDKLVNNKSIISYLNLYKNEKLLEVSFERNKYFENICKFLKNRGGIFLTIDYGYTKNIRHFTLQAVQNHKYSFLLDGLGEKDVSSHVNFNDFIKIAKDYKLKIEEYCSQREFLIKYGIIERSNYLLKKNDPNKILNDLNRLISKNEMGKLFKVLVVSNL